MGAHHSGFSGTVTRELQELVQRDIFICLENPLSIKLQLHLKSLGFSVQLTFWSRVGGRGTGANVVTDLGCINLQNKQPWSHNSKAHQARTKQNLFTEVKNKGIKNNCHFRTIPSSSCWFLSCATRDKNIWTCPLVHRTCQWNARNRRNNLWRQLVHWPMFGFHSESHSTVVKTLAQSAFDFSSSNSGKLKIRSQKFV